MTIFLSDMRVFGLIGFPLSHSFSKKFFTEKFANEKISGCRYELFPLERIEQFVALFSDQQDLCGVNVTIPYKVQVLPYLDELEEAAHEIGAVNCIHFGRKNAERWIKGYNTDAYGFAESLKPLLTTAHQKALIFGDGGAAKAVKYMLKQLNIPYLVVVRNPAPDTILYSAVTKEILAEYQLLINTTPLGMSPNLDSCPPIPYQFIGPTHLAYDLVYNPEETKFLSEVKARGGTIKNGLEMLYLQAERSWYIWNNA